MKNSKGREFIDLIEPKKDLIKLLQDHIEINCNTQNYDLRLSILKNHDNKYCSLKLFSKGKRETIRSSLKNTIKTYLSRFVLDNNWIMEYFT